MPGGTHGWLKIRAEIGEGGAVSASISPSTKDGQESLHRDLPAISAFLESERVPVSLQVGHVQAFAGGLDGGKLEPAGSTAQTSGDGGGTLMDAGAQQQSQREQPATSYEGEVSGDGHAQHKRGRLPIGMKQPGRPAKATPADGLLRWRQLVECHGLKVSKRKQR